MYKLAYKGISGTEPEEGFAKESFFHLIHQEHLEGVKEFHTLYPSILQQANISEEELTHAALKSNNAGILKYCIENILKTTVSKQIPPHMVSLTINDMAKKDLGMLAYILSNYDLSQASKQTKLNWVKHILENGKITKELGIILALFPDLMPDILEMLPGAFVCQEQNGAHIALFEGLLAHQVPLQRVLELYASYVGEGEPKGLSQVAPLAFLMTRGADFFATDPVDGEVLLFKVLRNMAFSLDRDTFSTHVASNPKLLTVRSREGWGIVEFLQRHFMEGKSDSLSYPYGFPSLKLDISTLGGNYAQESYALYTDQGAPTYSNPFRHTDTRQWLEALRRANSSEEWRTLARTCPSSDDVLFLKERAQDNQPLALAELPMPGWYRGYQQAKQWAEKVTAAFTKENAEDGSHLIAEEVYLEDCEFGPLIQLMEENEIFRPLVAQFHEKRKALRQEIEAWEEAVKLACASGDFKAVQNSLQAMPPVIPHSVAEALGSLIKNMPSNLSMEELEGILETRRQEIEGWKQGIQQALSAPEPDLKRLATYLEVAPSMKELSQYVGNFMEEEVLALFPNVLRRLYTTPDTFMNENKVIKTGPYGTVSGPSSLLLHALYLNTSVAPQVINAILDHAETLGVITPLLTRLKESEFFHLLHVLNGEKIRYLLQTHPGVFLHKSKTQDFFAAALDKLPKDLKNDFIMQHQYKLKERTVRKALSVPYFWILFSELNEQLLGTLIQNDPALLDLKTEDGFSPIEVIDSVNLSAKTKKRAKSLLENPQHVDAEAKPLSQDAFGVEKKDPHG